jgi:hypothetical protein
MPTFWETDTDLAPTMTDLDSVSWRGATLSEAIPEDPAEGDGSGGPGAGCATAKAVSNNGPPGVVWSPVAHPPSPGTPSAGTSGNIVSSREGISGDHSCVKGLHNQYHMHEVRFMGISGNPVRRVRRLFCMA